MAIKTLKEFISLESSAGIVLFGAAVLALILDNTPWSVYYRTFFAMPFSIHLGAVGLAKPVQLWVNDGLMTLFFLLVGLEIKRELFEGELNSREKAMLPGFAALGGMVVPALVFLIVNWHHPSNLAGWAIPTATDIAFSLGILSLLGSRVPVTLKIFLTALAIFDDIGAIVIIAIFYTAHISLPMLAVAAVLVVGLVVMNRCRVERRAPYFLVGAVLWFCVLKSGVHATLVGIVLGFVIPLRVQYEKGVYSPAKMLEHRLHPWVAFLVLPLFAFANAGVSFSGMQISALWQPLPLGIIAGLFLGKQVGIFGASWLAIKMGLAHMPRYACWRGIYGIALIAGVGFTMSLFIGSLAFGGTQADHMTYVRLGVLVGSFLSGILGYALLSTTPKLPLKSA